MVPGCSFPHCEEPRGAQTVKIVNRVAWHVCKFLTSSPSPGKGFYSVETFLLLLALKVIIYSSLMLKLQVRNILCGLYVFFMLFLFVRSVLATLQQFKKCFSEFNL